MANADFEDRLQRIGTQAPQPQAGRSRQPVARQGVSAQGMMLGAVLMAVSSQAVKYANVNYDAIKQSSGVGTALGVGVGSLLGVLVSCWVMYRAVSPKADVQAARAAMPRREPSAAARFVFSLLGLLFGAIACFYMFLAGTARYGETEAARVLANGSVLIALALVAISVLFGLFALVLRGRGLGRVPLYFVMGSVLTYAIIRVFFGDSRQWISLVEMALQP